MFVVITTTLVLKQDLSWEAVQEGVYDMILFTTFVLMVELDDR